jgi:cyanate permease
MGVVSLGAGVFSYIGPQMLGSLRDWTGDFSIGWYMITGIAVAVLVEIVLLKKNSAARRVAERY